MYLTFGMHLDGVDWSNKPASIGELTLGPLGMLNLLETRLGLTAPNVHQAERINQYMARLQACDGPGQWFHDSFQADPWSTAKQMLFWRDQLVEAGWDGQREIDASARLQALTKVEQADESPRLSWRLHLLRGWSNENIKEHVKEVSQRVKGTSSKDGAGAFGGVSV